MGFFCQDTVSKAVICISIESYGFYINIYIYHLYIIIQKKINSSHCYKQDGKVYKLPPNGLKNLYIEISIDDVQKDKCHPDYAYDGDSIR